MQSSFIKKAFLASALFSLLAIIFLVGFVVAQEKEAPSKATEELKILQLLPSGKVEYLSQVVVMFNKPMVKLGEQSTKAAEDVLNIQPKIAGTYYWLNQYTLAYNFNELLKGSVELEVEVKEGLKSLDGTILNKGRKAKISLPRLEIKNLWLLEFDYGENNKVVNPLKPEILISYNQAVDYESLKDKIKIVLDADKEEYDTEVVPVTAQDLKDYVYNNYIYVHADNIEQYKNMYFKVKLKKDLPKNANFNLVQKAGVNPLIGNGSSVEFTYDKKERKISSYQPLRVTLNTYTYDKEKDVDPDNAPGIIFNNRVDLLAVAKNMKINNAYNTKKLIEYYSQIEVEEDGKKIEVNRFGHVLYLTNLKPESEYNVALNLKGIKDAFGQEHSESKILNFKTDEFSPRFNGPDSLGVFEKESEAKLLYKVRNLAKVEINALALNAEDYIKFLNDSRLTPDDSYYYSSDKEKIKIEAFFNKHKNYNKVILPQGGAKQGVTAEVLNLKELFVDKAEQNKIMLIRSSWPTNVKFDGENYEEKFNYRFSTYQISNLSILAKLGYESSLVWVTNVKDASLVAEASLKMFDGQGLVIWEGKTDQNGLAKLPGANELKVNSKNNENVYILAQSKDGDSLFWSNTWKGGVNLWQYSYYHYPSKSGFNKVSLLSSLPLYKPSEEVDLKIIARNAEGILPSEFQDKAFKVFVKDPNGQEVFSENKKFNEFGTLNIKFTLAQRPTLGSYYAVFKEIIETKEENEIAESYAGSFSVAEYRPSAFDIKIEQLPNEIISGDKVEIKTQANYHFGLPVSKQAANYTVQSFETYISLPGAAADYNLINTFNLADNYEDSEYGYREAVGIFSSGEGKLDEEGNFNFTINLTKEKDALIKPYRYEAGVVVTDVDKRAVGTQSSFIVHPAEVYVGLKLDKFLAEAKKPMKLNYLVADLNGKLLADKEIEYKIYKRSWKNARSKTPGAVYGYSSKAVDTLISTEKVVSGNLPKVFEFTPTEAGYYFVVASVLDAKKRVNQASLGFYVIGDDNIGWYMENKDNMLDLVSDKTEYAIGETAQVMLKSPFNKGWALVTVERAGIKSQKVYEVKNNTPVFEIPITEDDYPNTYVSVSLIRGRIDDKLDAKGADFGKPSARIGYLELNVKSEKDVLKVEVKPTKSEVKTGEEVEISLNVKDFKGEIFKEAEVTLIVADAATLQLVSDNNYYPHKRFQVRGNLLVETSNSLFSLVGRRNWGLKGANPGGGGGPEMAIVGLDTMNIREDFTNLAYYNPNLKLDDKGEVTVKFKMPDNLTTFKIYAVAISKDLKMGTGLSEILVTKDLLVRSSLPAYIGTEDEFMASFVLTNRSKNKGLAKVELTGENFTLLEASNLKTVEIGPNEGLEISFKVKAKSEGQAKFVFKTVMGEESDAAQYVLPVYQANKLTAEASYELLTAGEKNVQLSILDTDLSRGFLELELSPSLLDLLKDGLIWINEYPHNFVESETSRAYANLLWLSLKNRVDIKEVATEQEMKTRVEEHIAKLKTWEYDGSFSYWSNQKYNWSDRSPLVTAYVLEFLIDAKKQGFKSADAAFIERISNYLKSSISMDNNKNVFGNYSQTAKRNLTSYIVYVLKAAGNNVKAETEVLYGQRASANLYELNNILGLVENKEQKEEIIRLIANHVHITAGAVSLKEQNYYYLLWANNTSNLAATLESLLLADEKHEFIPYLVRFLANNNNDGQVYTTQSYVKILRAFSLYVEKFESGTENINIEASLNNDNFLKAKFTNFQDKAKKSPKKLTDIKGKEAAVNYKITGEGQAWANLKLFTAPKEIDLTAKGSGGFLVERSYKVIRPEKSAEGINEFKRGDVVKITLTMLVMADRANVVLEDRIPAGFEAINFDFKTADSSLISETESSYNTEKGPFWWPNYSHQEIWPEKVAVYYSRLVPGVYTYSYLARAVTEGEYLTPGAQAEEIYAPEVFSRSTGAKVIIK